MVDTSIITNNRKSYRELWPPYSSFLLSINAFLSFLKRIRRYYKAIEILTGVSLVIMGILLIVGYFDALSGFMAKWFPWLLKG